MHIACEEVGLPVEVEKDEGAASLITFVGIELDSWLHGEAGEPARRGTCSH